MRKKDLMLTVLFALLLVGGCKNNDTPVTPDPPSDAELIISKTSVNLGPGKVYDVVTLRNDGEDNLSWSVTSKPEWVKLSQLASVLANRGWERLEISFDRSVVAHGEYSGTISIESNGGDVDIAVTLNNQPAELDVNQEILYFDRNGLVEDLILYNHGTDSLRYEITSMPDWIVIPGDSVGILDEPDTLHVEARPWGMDYGDYTGVILIESNGGNVDVTVSLSFQREVEVFSGEEAAHVMIGDIYQEVLDHYGQHDLRSYTINDSLEAGIHMIGYSWIGLKVFFPSRQLVLYPNVPCDQVTLEVPYDGLIDNVGDVEIGLGSTRDEIVAVFGEPDSVDGDEEVYDTGIAFTYGSDQLSKIRVWEP
ncbi:hypothetical protein HQ585_14510 [candidate division KSB1 bacterium]|nr:hypothetical protein [candidate division KSB1 bacterium]